jgi:hypothetical protein
MEDDRQIDETLPEYNWKDIDSYLDFKESILAKPVKAKKETINTTGEYGACR